MKGRVIQSNRSRTKRQTYGQAMLTKKHIRTARLKVDDLDNCRRTM
jgi:hypothetical protein